MRNTPPTKQPQDHERAEQEQEDVQPIGRPTGEKEEEEALALEDLEEVSDHSMEELDEDDLANMQGPDA